MYLVLLLPPTLPKTRQNCPQPARSPHLKQLYDFVWGFRLVHIKPTIVNPVPNEVGNHHVNKKNRVNVLFLIPSSAPVDEKCISRCKNLFAWHAFLPTRPTTPQPSLNSPGPNFRRSDNVAVRSTADWPRTCVFIRSRNHICIGHSSTIMVGSGSERFARAECLFLNAVYMSYTSYRVNRAGGAFRTKTDVHRTNKQVREK
jgi:hypothetical protein